jgi:hypothetical protein
VRRFVEQLLARPQARLIRINRNEAAVPFGQIGLPGNSQPVLEKIGELIPGR